MRAYLSTIKHVNNCVVFAFDKRGPIAASNEWLTFLSQKPYAKEPKRLIMETFQKVRTRKPTVQFDEPMVFGMNPFFLGTIHGYTFVYQLIQQHASTCFKVLMAKEAQGGMLDLCTQVFGPRLVLVEHDAVIETPAFHFVSNKYHTLVPQSIMKEIIPRFIKPVVSQSLVVFKSTTSANITSDGVLTEPMIDALQVPKRFLRVTPESIPETQWASMVYFCKELIVPWNSCFFKAIHYLTSGHACQKLVVLVVGPAYTGQYLEDCQDANRPHCTYASVPDTKFVIYDSATTLATI